MKFAVCFLLCIVVLCKDVFGQEEEEEEGDACTDNDNKRGVCKPINQCVQAIDNLKNKITPKICGYVQTEAVVCCPDVSSVDATVANITEDAVNNTQTTNSTRIYGEISKAKCKEYATYSYRNIVSPVLSTKPQHEKIYDCHKNLEILTVGTLKASRKEFPHMAHIGYYDPSIHNFLFRCGGSLISEMFVLTTAFCIRNNKKLKPSIVRLGVTNVYDTEHRQIITISNYYLHPDHKISYNDIGLLKLDKPAEINEFVRPACLNTVRQINYKTGVVPGWGQKKSGGELSDDLLKSVLDIVANVPCNEHYKGLEQLENGIVDDLMICAAITSDQRRDACQGDGGAPLQERIHNSEELQCMSLIIGITSFGKPCKGQLGVPGVYTRVSAYIDWIEKIVWPYLL